MPVTLIKSGWESGELVFYNVSTGAEICRIGTSGFESVVGVYPAGGRVTVSRTLVANADFPIPFFIAPAPCKVINLYESHVTKSTTGETMQMERLAAGTAPGSGTAMLNASVALNITANTPQSVTGGAAVSALTTGETACLRVTAGSAEYAGGTIVATFEWV